MSLWAALGECRHKTHIHIVGIADSLRLHECSSGSCRSRIAGLHSHASGAAG